MNKIINIFNSQELQDWIIIILKKKNWKKILKSRRVDTDFSSHQRDWKNFEQENNLVALNVLFVSYNSEETKRAYKSIYNKRKNQVILLMIMMKLITIIILL